jgi:hypothetical protein
MAGTKCERATVLGARGTRDVVGGVHHQSGPGAKTIFGLYRPWYHIVLVFSPSLADASQILGALEVYDRSIMLSSVVLPLSASLASAASPAEVVLVDQQGHAYSAYLVEAGQTKVFVIKWSRGPRGRRLGRRGVLRCLERSQGV